MKNLLRLFTFLLLLTLTFSCAEKPAPKPELKKHTKSKAQNDDDDDDDHENLTMAQFDSMRTQWESGYRNYMAHDSLHYFDVAKDDFLELLGENGGNIDSLRLYMGMSSDTVPHLMLVALEDGTPSFDIIADYSKACPPTCNN